MGGEFSSLFINPAGLGFYKTGDFVLTPSYSFNKSKSTYLTKPESAISNNFNVGATGFVLGGPNRGKSVRSMAFGIAVNRVADFNNHVYYKGTNNKSSYSEKYLEQLISDNITDPNQVLKLQQKVKVTVTEVDISRKRISLSMKDQQKPATGERPRTANTTSKKPESKPQLQPNNPFQAKLAELKKKFKD